MLYVHSSLFNNAVRANWLDIKQADVRTPSSREVWSQSQERKNSDTQTSRFMI